MYYPHFGLKEPPFKITPNTDFFFSGGNRGAVLDALVYAITNGEGIIKVVGEVGSGKTMLCRMLQTILPAKIESIYLANPSVAPEDVLHAIAFELQLKLPKNADRLKVMQILQTHLLSRHAEGRQVVIFVEEAQGMPLATLEEIRLLSNLETKQDKLLQIVLFGQPELDDNLNQTQIRQLRERITHSFHLGPMQTKDIGEYLIFRLRAAGYSGPHLFSESAIKKISEAAEGLVRRVNILADKALLAAFAENVYLVTPKQVKAAIQDSEFGKKNKKRSSSNFLDAIFLTLLLLLVVVALLYVGKIFESQKTRQIKDGKIAVASALQEESSQAKIAPKKPPVKMTDQAPAQMPINPSTQVLAVPASVPIAQEPVTAPIQQQAKLPAKPAVLPDPAFTLLNKRLEITKSWLFSEPSTTVTLQIKALRDSATLNLEVTDLSQKLDVEQLYLYRKEKNAVTYTIILYGTFKNKSDALEALAAMPKDIKDNQPYIRTVGSINKELQ